MHLDPQLLPRTLLFSSCFTCFNYNMQHTIAPYLVNPWHKIYTELHNDVQAKEQNVSATFYICTEAQQGMLTHRVMT